MFILFDNEIDKGMLEKEIKQMPGVNEVEIYSIGASLLCKLTLNDDEHSPAFFSKFLKSRLFPLNRMNFYTRN